jgi:hypothetical protein
MPAASAEPPSSPLPELKDAHDDYERGDFSSARRRLRKVLEDTSGDEADGGGPDPAPPVGGAARARSRPSIDEARHQAKSLLDKMGTDRAVWILLAVSLLFLVITFVSYAGRS